MPKISVIIPVYNVEKFLRECLDSIVNQVFQDIEIICVDDQSTDNSLEILQEYARKDKRIIILQNERNHGLAYTRNVGLKKATGDYILFVDSDDYIEKNLLEIVAKKADGFDIVCFDYRKQDELYAGMDGHSYVVPDGEYYEKDFFIEAVNSNSIIYSAWSKLYSREFLDVNNIRFTDNLFYEDILFCFQCLTKAKKVYSIGKKLYIYRIRSESIMTKKLSGKNVEDYFFNVYQLTKEYLGMICNPQESDAIERYIQGVCRDFVKAYRRYSQENEDYLIPHYLNDSVCEKIYRIFPKFIIETGTIKDFSVQQMHIIKDSKYVIVYGAGDIAREVIELLDRKDIPIYGIAVSEQGNNRKSILGNKICAIEQYESIKKECIIVIATTPRYYVAIRKKLKYLGFTNYIEIFN